jgi:hypothetical protein
MDIGPTNLTAGMMGGKLISLGDVSLPEKIRLWRQIFFALFARRAVKLAA